MPGVILEGFDDLQDAFKAIGSIPATVSRQAVKAMGEAAKNAVKSQGEAMGVRSSESGPHLLDHIDVSRPKKGRDGNMKSFVTFTGVRRSGKSRIWNAAIAYIVEYGAPRRGIPARPFIATAMERYADEIAAPADEIIGGWIEETYQNT